MAMGGPYTTLNVDKYMQEKLQENINLSWDTMHRLKFSSKSFMPVI